MCTSTPRVLLKPRNLVLQKIDGVIQTDSALCETIFPLEVAVYYHFREEAAHQFQETQAVVRGQKSDHFLLH